MTNYDEYETEGVAHHRSAAARAANRASAAMDTPKHSHHTHVNAAAALGSAWTQLAVFHSDEAARQHHRAQIDDDFEQRVQREVKRRLEEAERYAADLPLPLDADGRYPIGTEVALNIGGLTAADRTALMSYLQSLRGYSESGFTKDTLRGDADRDES